MTLCSAPLVEGTLAAVVAASSGASLEKVLEEANHALTPKKMQLGENMGGSEPNDVTPSIQMHGKEAHWVVKTLMVYTLDLQRHWLSYCQNFVLTIN